MGIWECLLILFLEAAAAYLALDLVFRMMPVEPQRLRRSLRRWGGGYSVVALLLSAAGGLLQWHLARLTGALVALFNPVLWWAIWHHGVHKQFGFLWGSDQPRGSSLP